MVEFIVIALLAILVGVALFLLNTETEDHTTDEAYLSQGHLLSPAERSFMGVLECVISKDYIIVPKVRVADVLRPAKSDTRSDWQRAFNRISAKHFDYIICHALDFRIIAAIELDDVSHKRKNRKARDSFLKSATASADLPLLRFEARSSYTVEEVRQILGSLLRDDLKNISES